MKTICPILTKLCTHVCDHNILIKFDSHGNRFSHLGVTALYLQSKDLKNILSGSNFYTVRSTCLKHSQMFILYVQIILNNHYGSYFLWQKIGSGGIRVMDTFLVSVSNWHRGFKLVSLYCLFYWISILIIHKIVYAYLHAYMIKWSWYLNIALFVNDDNTFS